MAVSLKLPGRVLLAEELEQERIGRVAMPVANGDSNHSRTRPCSDKYYWKTEEK